MQEAVKKDDDRSLALDALIEGEATLAMFGVGMDDWKGEDIIRLPAERMEFTFNLLAPFMPVMGAGKTLRNAPPIISESMIFPYFKGMVFCAKLANEGGWAAIDEVYRNPPLSTEQILHPEKYRAKPDFPMTIDLGTLKPGDGWKEVGRNVLGEMQTAVMLRKHGGKTAAAGWDGDRYAVFEGPKNKLGLVWLSTWDSEDDAREFAHGYVAYQTAKVGNLGAPAQAHPRFGLAEPRRSTFTLSQRRGRDVAVIEGFSPAATAGLVDAAFQAKQTEMKPGEPKKRAGEDGCRAEKCPPL